VAGARSLEPERSAEKDRSKCVSGDKKRVRLPADFLIYIYINAYDFLIRSGPWSVCFGWIIISDGDQGAAGGCNFFNEKKRLIY